MANEYIFTSRLDGERVTITAKTPEEARQQMRMRDAQKQTGSRAALTPDPRKLAETQATATTEAITRAEAAAEQMRGLESRARDFGRLNMQQGTGPNTETLMNLGGFIGHANPRLEQMRSITNKITPFQPRGPGPLTDFEQRMLLLSSPNIDVTGPTNRANVEEILMMSRLANDRARMMRDYVNKTGSLTGFDETFADYEKRTRAATEKASPGFGLARESAPPGPRQAARPQRQREVDDLVRKYSGSGVD
jgi:hypothetical protein